MEKNILNQLRSDYEKLEIKPSADLWNKIEQMGQEIKEEPALSLKKPFSWWRYAAIMLLLVSVGALVYFNTNDDLKKTDYLVKKSLKKTSNLINPDLINESFVLDQRTLDKSVMKKAIAENHQKISSEKKSVSEKENNISEISSAEFRQPIVIKQSENNTVSPEKIKNNANFPAVAEIKTTKSDYISADELLLGREFDKTREESTKNDKKFGVVKLDKLFPGVDNVTVLGVTVYIDSK